MSSRSSCGSVSSGSAGARTDPDRGRVVSSMSASFIAATLRVSDSATTARAAAKRLASCCWSISKVASSLSALGLGSDTRTGGRWVGGGVKRAGATLLDRGETERGASGRGVSGRDDSGLAASALALSPRALSARSASGRTGAGVSPRAGSGRGALAAAGWLPWTTAAATEPGDEAGGWRGGPASGRGAGGGKSPGAGRPGGRGEGLTGGPTGRAAAAPGLAASAD